VCRNEKWMSQKDHSILSLIRLNATYTHSHTRRYFSLILSLFVFFAIFFQAVYLYLTPPLTPCTEERRDANFFFSLSLSLSVSLSMKMLFDYPLSLFCEHTALLLSTYWRSSSPGCCSYWLVC
jgi:hypothetical protein